MQRDSEKPSALRRVFGSELTIGAFFGLCVVFAVGHLGLGCNGWDPLRPFEKSNEDVDRAIEMIEAGQYENAEEVLTTYLRAGACDEGKIKLPEKATAKADGAFDLGLVLFHLGEKYGHRFGDEKNFLDPKPETVEELEALKTTLQARELEVKCALLVALAIAKDQGVSLELRARAYYLVGNLEFLRVDYKAAILGYEQSLKLIPGAPENSPLDGIGRDAAWNRAVALRRLEEEQEDAGGQDQQGDQGQGPQPQDPQQSPGDQDQDGGKPDKPDGPEDGGGPDAGDSDGQDAGDAGEKPAEEGPDGGEDAGPDAGDNQGDDPDAGEDDAGSGSPDQQEGDDPSPSDQEGDEKVPGPVPKEQGDRVLDQFDQTPSYQAEEAKKRADGRRRTEDK